MCSGVKFLRASMHINCNAPSVCGGLTDTPSAVKKILTSAFLFYICSRYEKRYLTHHTNITLIRCLVRGFD